MTSPAPNQYGNLAQHHFRIHCPGEYRRIEDPRAYFYSLGEQIADRIYELTDKVAGPDSPGEAYLHKVGRLGTARSQAEEIVLAEMVYSHLETETGDPNDEFETDVPLSQSDRPFFRDMAEIVSARNALLQDDPPDDPPTATR